MQDSDNHNLKFVSFSILGIIVLAILTLIILGFVIKNQPSVQPTPIVTLSNPAVQPRLITTGFTSPTAIVATRDSSDKRLFVVEQAGAVRSFIPGSPELTPFLDIKAKVSGGGEMGLLGLAFHPDFSKNGYLFVNYVDTDQNTIIARYQTAPTGAVDTASEKVLIKLKQPYPNHNGGDLAFGPDGYLYIALGDGGAAGDPQDRAQNKNTLLGKILRIDVNNGDLYEVPASNPFASESEVKKEIWAYGLRNPWRISFDRATGDLYIADVGQGNIEEIDVQKSSSTGGENYGWRCYEGKRPFNTAGCQAASNYIDPVLEYDHSDGRCSVTGGYVYRGSKNPALVGKYFYGDFCNGQLFYGLDKNDTWTQTLAAQTPYAISAFGQASDGELYFADYKTGSIYQVDDTAN
jgi:glucose/arabinose dehydrogenase